MSARLLRAADRPAAPWKNGGGVTREIAAFLPGSDLETFDLRVSMATVSAGGPFSLFPGVDRILSVLEGELILDLEGGKTVRLDPDRDPFAFSGDLAVHAQTPPRVVTDLNVMTRRGRATARVSQLRAPNSIAAGAQASLILALAPRSLLRIADGGLALDRFDAVLVRREEAAVITLEADGVADFPLVEFDEP